MVSSSYIQNCHKRGRDLEKIIFQTSLICAKLKIYLKENLFLKYIIHLCVFEMHFEEKIFFLMTCSNLVSIPNINFLKSSPEFVFSSKDENLSLQVSSDFDHNCLFSFLPYNSF